MSKAHRDAYYAAQKVPLWAIYLRDQAVCHLCGEIVKPRAASRDHVVPVSKGGKTTWENIKLAHRSCNSNRGSRVIEQ